MSYADNRAADAFAANDLFAADAATDARASFLRWTYGHLFAAIVAFIGLSGIFMQTPAIREPLLKVTSAVPWIFILIGFMVVGWVAEKWAASGASMLVQYAGLTLYTLAEAIIFVPLLYVAHTYASEQVIPTAGMLTSIAFGGLTATVFVTGADFSFLRTALVVLGFILLGGIVLTWIFEMRFSAVLFASVGATFACGAVLYSTSNVLHHYRTDQYVSASLQLFASIALLFWYVLQLVLWSDD